MKIHDDTCKNKCWEMQGNVDQINAGSCWEAQGQGEFRHRDERKRGICRYWSQVMQKLVREAGGRGEVRRRNKMSARVAETRGGSLDIETAWMQEVAERHRGAGEIRILKQHKCKKLCRGQRWPTGVTYIWNQMDAGSWEAHCGEGKVRCWNKISARSCWGEA